jgi:catechol 2,3-dioxygenase-like lactoylglutathione lyase family enzyme
MNRVHVVTLGVEDMNRSLKFYRDGLGFKTSVKEEDPPIVFFQSDGATLALCPRDGMAKDISQENPPQGEGFSGITLAYVAREQSEVDRIMELAKEPGERSSRNLSGCSGEATAGTFVTWTVTTGR